MDDTSEDIARTLGLGGRGGGRRWWVAAVLVAAAVVAGGWFLLRGNLTADKVQYDTATVSRGDFRVTISATGTVEPTNLVEVSSELSGTLKTVEVDFNDEVEVGTVLARLDTTKLEAQVAIAKASLDAAIARVAVAQASLDTARANYEIMRDLEARGVTTHQDLVAQQASFSRAQAELQSAQADRSLSEANLDLYKLDMAKACICSPIKGIVLDRAADPGQIVAASFSAPVLFTLAADLKQMQLQVDIDEADIGRVAVGNAAEFTVDAYPDRSFPAEISEIRFAPETVDGVVTYKAILSIDNSSMLLRPGMTATAEIVVAEVADALVVPNAALRYAPPRESESSEDRSGLLGMIMPHRPTGSAAADAKTVWALAGGIPREVPVRTGDSNGQVTQILGEALSEGDLVITGQSDE